MIRRLGALAAVLAILAAGASCTPRTAPRYEYACLTVTLLHAPGALMNHSLRCPAAPGEENLIFGTTPEELGGKLGIARDGCDTQTILNHLAGQGWRLVAVEREPSREVGAGRTPEYLHHHLIRELR